MHQRQPKIGPGPIKKKKIKNICEIILNTPNVPNGRVPSCTADTNPRAKYCAFLEGAAEQKGIIEATDKPPHTTASPSPTAPWGRATTDTRPRWVSGSGVKPLREAGGVQPPLPSRRGTLKKKKSHPRDLVMTSGLRSLANEEARAKISNFCQIPGKAHCYQ